MMKISKNSERGFGKSSPIGGFVTPLIDMDFLKKYEEEKYKKLNKLKGGKNIMETKSRYEVIAELEENKRDLIMKRDDLPTNVINMNKELKNLKREVEDKEESIKEYEATVKTQKETFGELINSINESLDRFAKLGEKKS